jgi:hypothetical protein
MTGASKARDAHAPLYRVLHCVDVADDTLCVATDFVAQAGLELWDFQNALSVIDDLLVDATVSNSDIKGMLNRVGGFQHESPFGADAKAARKHPQAARDAIAAWIEEND